MSYDSASLTTPDISKWLNMRFSCRHFIASDFDTIVHFKEWLGLRPSDLDKYNLPEQCRLDMTENDIKTGQELMKEEFIMKNPKWMKELEIMVSYFWSCAAVAMLCVWETHGRFLRIGENKEKGGDSGSLFVWFPIRH